MDQHSDPCTILGVIPFFHMFGLVVTLMSGLTHGCKIVSLPKFTPQDFLQAIQDYKVLPFLTASRTDQSLFNTRWLINCRTLHLSNCLISNQFTHNKLILLDLAAGERLMKMKKLYNCLRKDYCIVRYIYSQSYNFTGTNS